jgi:hypothetical protein
MADSGELAYWVSQLADSDPKARGVAASHLSAEAELLCQPALLEWVKDPDFHRLLIPVRESHESGETKPHITVGIAVQPATFEKIRSANGSPQLARVPPDQDAMEFELSFADAGDFDILTTRDAAGPGAIARYLQKFGEGIQQIEVSVSDADRATEILRTRFALTPIYPATRAGADGTRVNFFLAPVAGGKKVLIELVESAK